MRPDSSGEQRTAVISPTAGGREQGSGSLGEDGEIHRGQVRSAEGRTAGVAETHLCVAESGVRPAAQRGERDHLCQYAGHGQRRLAHDVVDHGIAVGADLTTGRGGQVSTVGVRGYSQPAAPERRVVTGAPAGTDQTPPA